MPIVVGATPASTGDGTGIPGEILHDGQVALGAITLGMTDDYGVEWILESLSGWDTTASTGQVEQRSADHGGWASPAYYSSRVIELNGSLLASSYSAASRALDRLFAAVPLSTLDTLYVGEPERTLQADVRQEGDPLTERSGGWARFSLSLIAPDPRRYSTDTVTASTGLPSTSGGITLPLTLPLTIGATTASGVLSVVNAGNMSTRPVFTITGPCPPCSITHRGTGRTLQIPDAIEAGRSLTIDTDTRTALLDGTARRRIVGGAGLAYEPGTNEVAFSASTYDAGALLKSEHRSAWR